MAMPAAQTEIPLTNGHDGHVHPPPVAAKKKGKKAMDSNEASRLLQARISQLEQDAAGEKDQELEIEREVKKANRDLLQQVSKMDNMQKIDHLTKRSSELLADMRRLEKENQKNKRRGDNLQKERDTNRTELSKTVGLKEKLEKLCRELQRDNNKMKNENKEHQTLQKSTSQAWDEKYATLLSKLEGYQEEKDTPRKQVVDMEVDELFRVRFKSFIDQYELRELHFHSLMRTKELEVQYHMARYEREKKNAEAESTKGRHLQAQVQAFTKTEAELRNQLNVYVDKFKQVEDTLNNSNDLFLSFRKEMEDMSKKGKRLEKDNDALKRQKEATAANIIRMAEERQEWKKKSEALEKKCVKLTNIIHQMQEQGRKVPVNISSTVENGYSDSHGGAEGDESDYSDEEGEDEELSEFDDDTEEEPQPNEHDGPGADGGPGRAQPTETTADDSTQATEQGGEAETDSKTEVETKSNTEANTEASTASNAELKAKAKPRTRRSGRRDSAVLGVRGCRRDALGYCRGRERVLSRQVGITPRRHFHASRAGLRQARYGGHLALLRRIHPTLPPSLASSTTKKSHGLSQRRRFIAIAITAAMEFLQRLARFLDRPLFPWKRLIMGFSVGQYLFESFLTMRQYRVLKKTTPPAVLSKEVSQEVFDKSQAYGRAKAKYEIISGAWSQIQNIAFIQYDVLPKLWSWTGDLLLRWAPARFTGEISHSIVFVLGFLVLSQLLRLPGSIYNTFVLEEKFGFNKQTPKLFITDLLKSQLLTFILAPPILAGFLKIIQKTGNQFFFYLWAFAAGLQVFMITIYPIAILPLFNKLSPLDEGELKSSVESLAASLKFPLHELYVIDGSKRSAHSNAYFFGLPWKKHIVIYDTLIEKSEPQEVVAVLAHELGHWKLGHTTSLFSISQAHLLYIFTLFSVFINNNSLYSAFGFLTEHPIIIGFILFSDALSPMDLVVQLGMNIVTRKFEFEADAFAKKLGYPEELARSLLKLQIQNLSTMDADWMYASYHFSHPHLSERLKAIGWKGSEGVTEGVPDKSEKEDVAVKASGREEL
ncbi:hypothetical protein G7046_g5891 [Stylonectria norvegica]|nr:hypothetical protein G7046_g5891 [Stylonectria norvegica]